MDEVVGSVSTTKKIRVLGVLKKSQRVSGRLNNSQKVSAKVVVTGPRGRQGEAGVDAKDVEFSKTATHIRWRYVGTTEWFDLVPLADIKGDQGIQGVQGIPGINGTNGVNGTNGIDGQNGSDGVDGVDGQDGRPVELRKTVDYVQWRYVGDVSWVNLIPLADIRGEQGVQGIKGDKGDTGSQGIQGIQGDKGDKGDTGLTGAKGDKGDKGDQGEQGIAGSVKMHVRVESSDATTALITDDVVIMAGSCNSISVPAVDSSNAGKMLMLVNNVGTLVSVITLGGTYFMYKEGDAMTLIVSDTGEWTIVQNVQEVDLRIASALELYVPYTGASQELLLETVRLSNLLGDPATGGNLNIIADVPTAQDSAGGNVYVAAASGLGNANGGIVYLLAGSADANTGVIGDGGFIYMQVGAPGDAGGQRGFIRIDSPGLAGLLLHIDNITAERNLYFPDEDGTIATQEYVAANAGGSNMAMVIAMATVL